jgi:hypothetical protein
MTYSDGLRRLTTVVERLEECGANVVFARPDDPTDGDENGTSEGFRVTLCVDLPEEVSRGRAVEREERRGRPDDLPPPSRASQVPARSASGEGTPGAPSDRSVPGGPARSDGESDDSERGERAAEARTDGVVACRADDCDRTFETDHGMKIHFTKMHGADCPDGGGPAPYRDPARLQAAYEATESFAAMRDELGVDVSPETVRQYAIRHGVHGRTADGASGSDRSDDSTQAPTGSPGEEGEADVAPPPDPDAVDDPTPAIRRLDPDETVGDRPVVAATVDGSADDVAEDAPDDPTTEADGDPDDEGTVAPDEEHADGPGGPPPTGERVAVSLPEELTLDEVTASVRTSNTLYEASRALGLDREETTELLDELNLLDLVHGRVATKGRRDDLKTDIEARLRDAGREPSLST